MIPMAKRKRAKAKGEKRSAGTPNREETADKKTLPGTEESDGSADYGGLPLRDLKKNLGCG